MAESGEKQALEAYAKINLSLEILGRRSDGFHNIMSVMQTVDLHDTLILTSQPDLEFDCSEPELVTEDNLVWKAALALLAHVGEAEGRGAHIYLEKRIPVAAGLGGGSSDGAATLLALNEFWELNLPVATLEEIAAKLGSDVPFFVRCGTQLAEERGEKLTPLPSLPTTWLVLLYPDVPMPPGKTGELYKMLSKNDYTNGGVTRALVEALGRGEPPSQSYFYNSFEHVVYERFPQIDLFRQALVEVGADYVRVSGSGPTLFSTFPDEATARRAAEELTANGFVAFAVKTL